MKDDKFIGSIGATITGIDCSDVDFKLNKLSDFDEDFSIPVKCTKCNQIMPIKKEQVNKLIKCKCGQKIYIDVPNHFL